MGEAERYTTEMWQRHLGRVMQLGWWSKTKLLAFNDGFNGQPEKGIHYTARDAYDLGRHSAILLGYIKEPSA